MDDKLLISSINAVMKSVDGIDIYTAIPALGEAMVSAIIQHSEDVTEAKAMLLECMVAMNEAIHLQFPD